MRIVFNIGEQFGFIIQFRSKWGSIQNHLRNIFWCRMHEIWSVLSFFNRTRICTHASGK